MVGPFELFLVETNPQGRCFPEGVILFREPGVLGGQRPIVLEQIAARSLPSSYAKTYLRNRTWIEGSLDWEFPPWGSLNLAHR